jgi:hypothetical protein
MLGVWYVVAWPIRNGTSTDNTAPTWVVSPSERLVTTEDGSALVTDRTTISLVEFDEVPLLSTWRSQSTPLTMTRRSLLSVRPCIDAYSYDDYGSCAKTDSLHWTRQYSLRLSLTGLSDVPDVPGTNRTNS